jgi:hypothetical protein
MIIGSIIPTIGYPHIGLGLDINPLSSTRGPMLKRELFPAPKGLCLKENLFQILLCP